MTTRREAFSTIADLSNSRIDALDDHDEPRSQVGQAGSLAGGVTMWQARLVLSTLDQSSAWAQRLRQAIREGNAQVADELLDAIYARNNSGPPQHNSTRPSFISDNATTVLPPSPSHEQKQVG